ncbi:MAG: hypothetical protein AB7D36_06245 [Oscillospiraceae bacterium]
MKKSFAVLLAAMLLLSAGCGSSPVASPSPTATDEVTASSLPETNAEGAGNMLMLKAPGIPSDAERISETDGDDGTCRTEWLYDGAVTIALARVPCAESDEESIAVQIGTLTGMDTADFTAAVDENLSQEFSYPVWRITYTTGENEDTHRNVDVYIQTDDMDYWFHTATPADFYTDYEPAIGVWISSLVLSD